MEGKGAKTEVCGGGTGGQVLGKLLTDYNLSVIIASVAWPAIADR